MDYLTTILGTEKYIADHRITTPHGLYWDINKSFKGEWKYYDEISLYAGSSGIIKFYLNLYHVFKEQYYYDQAYQAGKYLVYRWNHDRHMKKAFSQYAITTGYAGVAFILDQLYQLTNDPVFHDTVAAILKQMVTDQQPDGAWSNQIGVVADGGTALVLAQLGVQYQVQGIDFALKKFGDYILSHQHHDQLGDYYVGLDLKFVGGPIGKFNTGFPLGPAGVAFVLLKIWQFTGDDKYLQGTKGINEFYEHHSITDDAIVLPHYLPDEEHIDYVGYCGGPTGTSRYFFLEHQLSHDQHDKELFLKSVAGLEKLHAPEKRSAGFWDLDNYCCSTAGILQMYIGVYLATKDEKILQRAKLAGQIINQRATYQDDNTKWVQAFERKNPQNKTAAIGYYDGAAGIADSLLQLYLLENEPANLRIVRMPDDPYPTKY